MNPAGGRPDVPDESPAQDVHGPIGPVAWGMGYFFVETDGDVSFVEFHDAAGGWIIRVKGQHGHQAIGGPFPVGLDKRYDIE